MCFVIAMNELQELREKIESQDYQGAIAIINELEEMSVEDKLNKIYSYMVVLLVHLIKQRVEKKSTKSWERSIFNSVKYINKTNKRRRAGGYYASEKVLQEIIEEAFPHAVKEASYEIFEGKMSVSEIEEKIDFVEIKDAAMTLIKNS